MGKKPEWPEELVQQILTAYVKEYLEWSDTTHGPSLIGTRNDLYRLQMLVMDSYAEENSDLDYYYKEIISLFDNINLSEYKSTDDIKRFSISQPVIIDEHSSAKEKLKMAEHFSQQELTLFDKIIASISAVIFYGISFAIIIYLLFNLDKW